MKFSTSTSTTYLWVAAAATLLWAPLADAARGTSGPRDLDLKRYRQRELMMSDSSDGSGGGGGGGGDLYGYDGTNYQNDVAAAGGTEFIIADRVDGPLLDNQCYICTQEDKVRPPELSLQYFGGQGVMSRYQDSDKATCTTQMFPVNGTVNVYDQTFPIYEGATITFSNPKGEMDAETDFYFTPSTSVSTCFIHTSCSQPLVAGDRLGPWLVLAGNGCTFPYCGDGNVDEDEECDEGEANMPSMTCRANCTKPQCGDGIVDIDMFEACDEGDAMPTATCRNCTIPFCGDGIIDSFLNETCDDGDAMPTETCSNCTSVEVDIYVPVCGDMIVDMLAGEECDEGDAMPTATCNNCTVPSEAPSSMPSEAPSSDPSMSPSATPSATPSAKPSTSPSAAPSSKPSEVPSSMPVPSCGDGFVDMTIGEECDEGEAMPSPTCREDCSRPYCGDNITDTLYGEECDLGTALPTALCRLNCTIPRCGDGILDPNEQCDEGSLMPTENCRVDCTQKVCGDGVQDDGEECDLGAAMPTPMCRADCTKPQCGDNRTDLALGEECDEGPLMPTYTCYADCKIPRCGDGIIDVALGELCDTFGIDTVDCRGAECVIPTCGDGIVDTIRGEMCDSFGIDTVDCRGAECVIPTCGDGIVDTIRGEMCDSFGIDTVDCRGAECVIPTCGDGIVDTIRGEMCDSFGIDTVDCRGAECVIPTCGDGIVDTIRGEMCDSFGIDTIDCTADCLVPLTDMPSKAPTDSPTASPSNSPITEEPTASPSNAPSKCVCEASATYNEGSGAVTIKFDMCDQLPLSSDFIGIYPCQAPTRVADQAWWKGTVCRQFPAACSGFQFGYIENEIYVAEEYTWFSYTCGSPRDGGCQTSNATEWPTYGTVEIDPTMPNATWAYGKQGRTLDPGCYKVLLNREMYFISPPPYPTICGDWATALTFDVPARRLRSLEAPLEIGVESEEFILQSGSVARFGIFIPLLTTLVLYVVNKE